MKKILTAVSLFLFFTVTPALFGAHYTGFMFFLVAMLGQREFYYLIEKQGAIPNKTLGLSLGALMLIMTWMGPLINKNSALSAGGDMLAISIIIISFWVINRPQYEYLSKIILPTFLGIVLLPYFFHFMVRIISYYTYKIHDPALGVALVYWFTFVAKTSDIGGYLAGIAFGRHKLIPKVSPGKTYEGAVGGICFSTLSAVLIYWVCGYFNIWPESFTLWKALIMGAILGFLAIPSDLIISVLKRQSGLKDSASVFPGYGGLLDVIDSLILTYGAGFVMYKYLVI